MLKQNRMKPCRLFPYQTKYNNLPEPYLYSMSAARRLSEAEALLDRLRTTNDDQFEKSLEEYINSIYDTCNTLLDEYNRKFGCGIERITLEKFKTKAKKLGNVDAIRFLVWYDREFRKIRDDPDAGQLLERGQHLKEKSDDTLKSCSTILELTRKLVYGAYENF